MDEILHQLGDLFLGSVPTIILFLLVLALYTVLVHKPLLKVLAERRERTLGTVEKASAAVQAADARTQEYEAKLHAARLEAGRQREQRLQQWSRERENALADARHVASERVKAARAGVDREMEAAKLSIEESVDQLASQILKTLVPASPTGGAR